MRAIMVPLSVGSLAVAALALLWLGLAATIAIVAARRYRLAEGVLGTARVNARLLELMPSRPLVVWPDGRIEADERLVRELGLESAPTKLSELSKDGGIVPEDLATLSAMVEMARASAARVSCNVRSDGIGRVFDVRGGPAPPSEPPGTLLLWFVDVSASEEERAGDELIFVDQTVLRELRSDGAAAEDHDVSTGLPFERLDRPRLEFVEQT